MSRKRTEFIDEQTLKLLRQAGAALGDGLWWAIVGDGAMCGDDRVAAVCVELAVRVSRQAVRATGADTGTGPTIEDALSLLESGLKDAMAVGARSMGHIARLSSGQQDNMLAAFKAASAGVRECILAWVTRPGDDPLSTRLLLAGLNDRSRRVRLAEVDEAERSDSPLVLEELRRVMATEPDRELRESMGKIESKISKGYWIGPAEYGSRNVELRLDIGGSIPVATFDEFGEEAVMRRFQRYAQGIASPTFEEDERWFSEQNDRWRASADFAAFKEATAAACDKEQAKLDEAARSDQAKRAALVARLDREQSNLVGADAFLDGNQDEGSIGCNLDPHPGLTVFRRVIQQISARREVSGVLVEIKEVMDAPAWPFTDTLLICTSAAVKNVERWLRGVRPDGVSAATDQVPGPVHPGFKWLMAWWD